jgi:hypothetical protein
MRYLSNLLILLALIGCSETKTDLSGNTPLKINDFNTAFKNVELPIRINDTNLTSYTDTLEIGRKALEQFLPDSVVDAIVPEQTKNTSLYTVGKIEKETEYYLLLNNKDDKKQTVSVLTFSKKNVFLDFKILTQFDLTHKGSQFYGKTLLINKEPTFLVEETKLDPEQGLTNEKKGWAYTEQGFRLIYLDANIKPEQKAILNPIDTLPTLNSFSGDYARDKKNFISLRDFGNPNKYQFFLHFEKKEGTCVGELKGLLNFNKNQATYSEKGDPCTIQFTITGNIIKIKEDGNCGNHRNMTCYFNDNYDKKRKPKTKK